MIIGNLGTVIKPLLIMAIPLLHVRVGPEPANPVPEGAGQGARALLIWILTKVEPALK